MGIECEQARQIHNASHLDSVFDINFYGATAFGGANSGGTELIGTLLYAVIICLRGFQLNVPSDVVRLHYK